MVDLNPSSELEGLEKRRRKYLRTHPEPITFDNLNKEVCENNLFGEWHAFGKLYSSDKDEDEGRCTIFNLERGGFYLDESNAIQVVLNNYKDYEIYLNLKNVGDISISNMTFEVYPTKEADLKFPKLQYSGKRTSLPFRAPSEDRKIAEITKLHRGCHVNPAGMRSSENYDCIKFTVRAVDLNDMIKARMRYFHDLQEEFPQVGSDEYEALFNKAKQDLLDFLKLNDIPELESLRRKGIIDNESEKKLHEILNQEIDKL